MYLFENLKLTIEIQPDENLSAHSGLPPPHPLFLLQFFSGRFSGPFFLFLLLVGFLGHGRSALSLLRKIVRISGNADTQS